MNKKDGPYTIDDFYHWKQDTHDLYESQMQANQLIADIYTSDLEESLFDIHAPEHKRFIAVSALRAHYWKNNRALLEEIPQWIRCARERVADAINATDRLSMFRELVWIRLSSLPIIEMYTPRSLHADYLVQFKKIASRAEGYLTSVQKDSSLAVYRYACEESLPDILEQTQRQCFTHLYHLQRSALDKVRFIEVTEFWSWKGQGQRTLCLPLAIGCPNQCTMCELATFDGGNLSPEEIQHLISLTTTITPNAPVTNDPERLRIEYLAGGDPLLHSEIDIVLSSTAERYAGVEQLVSTVGLNIGNKMRNLITQVAKTPHAQLQVTVASLDDTIRRSLIRSHHRILSVDECIAALVEYYEQSGQKGFLSLFLLQDEYDDCELIMQDIQNRIDPETICIRLQLLQNNSLVRSTNGARFETYERLTTLLHDAGFEASIHPDTLLPEYDIASGNVHEETVRHNAYFKKNSLIDLS